MINDKITASGALTIILKDEFGNVKYKKDMKNLIVTVGKGLIATRLAGDTKTAPSIMSVGTGTTPAAIGQELLITEIGRVAVTSATAINNIVTYSATFNPGTATGALTEAALFSGTTTANNGTMLSRTVFLPVNKTIADTLIVNWQITIN